MHRLPEAVPDHTNSYTDSISRTWQEMEEGPPFDQETGVEAACRGKTP